MIIVLWAAMFLVSLLTPVLGSRRLARSGLVLYWVAVFWAAAHPASLGLDRPTDALIPSFLVILAGGFLGMTTRGVHRAVADWHHGPIAPAGNTPVAAGAAEGSG